MRRRKLRWVVVGLIGLTGVGAFVLWPRPTHPVIRYENYERIRNGMSRAEVEALLGPPGDYRTGPTNPHDRMAPSWDADGVARTMLEWEDDTAYVAVILEPPGVASSREYCAVSRMEEGPLGNLLWRIGRLWRRWFP